MIRDREIAQRVLTELFDVSGQLDGSVATVRDGCSESELITYRRAVGNVLGELWDTILKPILAEHPELTPPELRKPDA